jgi:hypothetical protein
VTAGGEKELNRRIIVSLTNTVTGAAFSADNLIPRADDRVGFAIYGVADGEYDVAARWVSDANEDVFWATAPHRVVVKGAGVSGIELKLLPIGSIGGKFTLETAPGVCESKRKWSLAEALLVMRSGTKTGGARRTIINGLSEKGEFTVQNLPGNRYFLEPRLPNEHWYVKAINSPARGALTADVARNGISLKAGEKVDGVTVNIVNGAAVISGRVIPAKEGKQLPARLRIHLVPAEDGAVDKVLRYAEVFTRSDGSFSLNNIAPGKYWLLATAAAQDDEAVEPSIVPIAWDANERAKLHQKAMAAKNEIELQPCGRVKDYTLRFDR